MLLELSIRDFAIIEQTTIQFADGMNVLTGETGAGKSILLDALGSVLGARVSSDLVRTGARAARVEAAFALEPEATARVEPLLRELDLESPDGSLVLSREILASGRSTARINGRLTTAGVLARVGASLVDIHGQSDHLAILRTTEQRNLLDRFAGLDDDRDSVVLAVRTWRRSRQQYRTANEHSREREQRVDLLRFQTTEIEEAGFSVGDDIQLGSERDVLRNADRLRSDALLASSLLAGDDLGDTTSASAVMRQLAPAIEEIALLDTGATSLAERANEILLLTEDLAREVRNYADGIEEDEGRLAEVEDRLALLQVLKRKYGSSIEEILEFNRVAREELASLTSDTYDSEALRKAEVAATAEVVRLVRTLSDKRQQAAGALARAIEESVSEMHMGRAELEISVQSRPDADGIEIDGILVHIDETGIDDVEYLLAPNAGEALKPLARIASGGEMARLMLAIKAILSNVDLTPTLVFDEIDVGVGGRIGQVVGEKLWAIGQIHQVVVVTHLPQIASFAASHLRIEKAEQADGRIVSSVRLLSHAEREIEIAAMIDGLPPGEAALLNAHTMLERSRSFMATSG